MVATPREPKGSGDASFVRGEHWPADEVDRTCCSCGVSVMAAGSGETLDISSIYAATERELRVMRLRDLSDRAHAVLDALDEQEGEDRPLVLQIKAKGNRGSVPDSVFDKLIIQYKTCHDHLGTLAELPECDDLGLSAGTSAEPDAAWQALPRYADRPFVPSPCWGASAFTSEAVAAAVQNWKLPIPKAVGHASHRHEFLHMQMREPVVPFTVTLRDKQLAEDYREGVRQFLGGVLDAVKSMVVAALTAWSHLAQVPSFLPILIAITRQYGRRGESNGRFVPAPYLHRYKRGAVCLAP